MTERTLFDDLEIAEQTYRDAVRTLVASLSPVPDGPCPRCGSEEMLVVEPGYIRYETATLLFFEEDGLKWHGQTRGYDAYGDCGIAEWLECEGCPARYQMPDDFDWD